MGFETGLLKDIRIAVEELPEYLNCLTPKGKGVLLTAYKTKKELIDQAVQIIEDSLKKDCLDMLKTHMGSIEGSPPAIDKDQLWEEFKSLIDLEGGI